MPLRVGDLVLPGHLPLPRRSDHLEVRGEAGGREVETHLVVALAGTAVGDVRRAFAARDLDHVSADQRTREGGAQRVHPLVERVRPKRGSDELLGELLASVDHERLRGSGGFRLRPYALEIPGLAHVDGERHDVGPLLLSQPRDAYGGIETSGVR